MSHCCNSCGVDLARVRVVVDPTLRLPIVVCPSCETACVRRRHPIHRFWRSARRADTALSIIFVQTILALILVGLSSGMIGELSEMAADRGETVIAFIAGAFTEQNTETRVGNRVIRNDDGRDAAIVVTALCNALTGIWLTATFAHHGFWKRWVGLIVVLLCSVSLNWVRWGYGSAMAVLAGDPSLAGSAEAGPWLIRLVFLIGTVAVMLLASPIGLPIRWLMCLVRGSMWRRQLRRARYSRGRSEQ